jgi:copper homeostasis protein CutC
VVSITEDCDHDTLLIQAHPTGAVCHMGWDTCFNEVNDVDDWESFAISRISLTSGIRRCGKVLYHHLVQKWHQPHGAEGRRGGC